MKAGVDSWKIELRFPLYFLTSESSPFVGFIETSYKSKLLTDLSLLKPQCIVLIVPLIQ